MPPVLFINDLNKTVSLKNEEFVIFEVQSNQGCYLENLKKAIARTRSDEPITIIFNSCYPCDVSDLENLCLPKNIELICLGIEGEKSISLQGLHSVFSNNPQTEDSKTTDSKFLPKLLKLWEEAGIVLYNSKAGIETSQTNIDKKLAIIMLWYAQNSEEEKKIKCLQVAKSIIDGKDNTESRFSNLEKYKEYQKELNELLEQQETQQLDLEQQETQQLDLEQQEPKKLDEFYNKYPDLSLYIKKNKFFEIFKKFNDKEAFGLLLEGDIYRCLNKYKEKSPIIAECLGLAKTIKADLPFLKSIINKCNNTVLTEILDTHKPNDNDIIYLSLILLRKKHSIPQENKLSTLLNLAKDKDKVFSEIHQFCHNKQNKKEFNPKALEAFDKLYNDWRSKSSLCNPWNCLPLPSFESVKATASQLFSSILDRLPDTPSFSPCNCCAKPVVDTANEVIFEPL